MSSNNSSLVRGRDGRIEPEQMSGAVEPDEDVVEVDGHGADVDGEASFSGVFEAVRDLENNKQ